MVLVRILMSKSGFEDEVLIKFIVGFCAMVILAKRCYGQESLNKKRVKDTPYPKRLRLTSA
jgi:hypothetical protein